MLLSIRKIGRTVLWTGGTALVNLAIGVLTARALGPGDRGVLATLLLWPTLAAHFGMLGLDYALSRRIAVQGGAEAKFLVLFLAVTLGQAGIAVVVAQLLLLLPGLDESLELFREHPSVWLVCVAGQVSLFAAGVFLGQGSVTSVNVLHAAVSFTILVGIATLVAFGSGGISSIVGAYAVGNLCVAIVAAAKCVVGAKPPQKSVVIRGGELLRDGVWVWVLSLISNVERSVGVLALSIYGDTHLLGLFVVANTVAALPQLWNAAFSRHLFAHTLGGLAETVRPPIERSLLVSALAVGLAITVVGGGLGYFLTPVVFGVSFLAACPLVVMLVPIAYLSGLNSLVEEYLKALGLGRRVAINKLIGMLIFVALPITSQYLTFLYALAFTLLLFGLAQLALNARIVFQ